MASEPPALPPETWGSKAALSPGSPGRHAAAKISGLALFKPEPSMPKKIRVEADICAPKPVPPKGFSLGAGHGQKVSLERGTSTRSKKNPGKRPKKGG